tara:strand:- start:512 stop:1114 length:603 start_codon:yes stop_codon:yes gene_type:complete
MLLKLLSSILYFFKQLITPRNYRIISEELEYTIDHEKDYEVNDDFWKSESKDWIDGILYNFYLPVTGRNFRNTIVPKNITKLILRIEYWYDGRVYKAITNDINFEPGKAESNIMNFTIPLSKAWLVDHDDKPIVDITDKVKKYSGPRNNFHGQKVALRDLVYYTETTLQKKYPKIILTNLIGMKKTLFTLEHFTTDLRVS